ncbi:MAG: c-type cytochrome [Steroidobacteraceae bacterium]
MTARPAAALWLLLGLGATTGWTADQGRTAPGESIYLRGVLGSGAPLEATRGDHGAMAHGAAAACVTCHRRSGLGMKEGPELIPPITGQFLFHSLHAKSDEAQLPYVENARANRGGYTDATLARVIRQGIDSDGKTLGYLMPRYDLSDADMIALIAYLKSLDRVSIPGVTDKVLHFATIITPDADPVKRRGMLDVMAHYVADKNTFPFPPSPPMRSSSHTLYSKSMYMAQRHWQLHVWQLTGPAPTWAKQLERDFAAEPVMAAVSGLGGSNWAPVHQFCERAHLPCLFPNVEVPVVADQDFYTLYFSRGVLLEADLIADRIRTPGDGPLPKSVLQVYRAGDSGEAAARILAATLKPLRVTVRSEVLAAGSGVSRLSEALRGANAAEPLVLWLRPSDIAALGEAPAAGTVYVSGLMGGQEHTPLPASWRGRSLIAYPFDLPDRSRVRVNLPLEWFTIRHIPVIALQVQLDTYLACGILAESIGHMADIFIPEYIVERAEAMLERRLMTGAYPRLTLSEGERFASKGGYMVRFAGNDGTQMIADRDWIVPN